MNGTEHHEGIYLAQRLRDKATSRDWQKWLDAHGGSLVGVEIDGSCTSFWCIGCDVQISERRWVDVANTVSHSLCSECDDE